AGPWPGRGGGAPGSVPPGEPTMMIRRRRLLGLAMALLALAPASAQALYSPHAGVVSATPADNTPNVLDGMVRAIVPLGNRIIVGGTFSQVQEVGKPALIRHGLFSFDPITGAVDPGFAPSLDVDPTSGREVEAMAPSPDGRS